MNTPIKLIDFYFDRVSIVFTVYYQYLTTKVHKHIAYCDNKSRYTRLFLAFIIDHEDFIRFLCYTAATIPHRYFDA